MIVMCYFAFKTYTLPHMNEINTTESKSKPFMLIFVTLIFGIEVGYKLASKQVLYLLSPCHINTVVEVNGLKITIFYVTVHDRFIS